jgi:NAD(P)-dependent dehydrogenase (short-subunit alcohol dehydrogenase family)
MNRLRDRVCLITGSTGIAAASARRLAGEGAAVFVASRTAAHAQALAESISAGGGRAGWAGADLETRPPSTRPSPTRSSVRRSMASSPSPVGAAGADGVTS